MRKRHTRHTLGGESRFTGEDPARDSWSSPRAGRRAVIGLKSTDDRSRPERHATEAQCDLASAACRLHFMQLVHRHVRPRGAGRRERLVVAMRRSAVSGAFVACEAIATDRALSTDTGDFADGYRAAANDIAVAIRAKRYGLQPTPLERDLRDAEMEARTLARIVAVAAEVVTEAETCQEMTGPEAVREVLAYFFDPIDLPPVLRPRTVEESTTQLISARKSVA